MYIYSAQFIIWGIAMRHNEENIINLNQNSIISQNDDSENESSLSAIAEHLLQKDEYNQEYLADASDVDSDNDQDEFYDANELDFKIIGDNAEVLSSPSEYNNIAASF